MLVWRVIAAALAVLLLGVVLVKISQGEPKAWRIDATAKGTYAGVREAPLADDLRAALRQRSMATRAW